MLPFVLGAFVVVILLGRFTVLSLLIFFLLGAFPLSATVALRIAVAEMGLQGGAVDDQRARVSGVARRNMADGHRIFNVQCILCLDGRIGEPFLLSFLLIGFFFFSLFFFSFFSFRFCFLGGLPVCFLLFRFRFLGGFALGAFLFGQCFVGSFFFRLRFRRSFIG